VPDRRAPGEGGCRWCGAPTSLAFTLTVLRKFEVNYLQCSGCSSLQTQRPYWLSDAYDKNLARLDTGAAQRNISNLAASYLVARIFELRNVLDFGGGDGLLCRLLRDYGLNCFVRDKYASATYALAFTEPDFARPDLMLAYEVLEHLVEPRTETRDLFAEKPKVVLASTSLYEGQARDWWYLAPETGQHVFFYSAGAMRQMGQLYGYEVGIYGTYVLFVRKDCASGVGRVLAAVALNKLVVRLMSAFMRLLPTKGVWADFERVSAMERKL